MEEHYATPAPTADTIGVKTLLRVNNQVISLNPFVQKYIAGVLCGILKSLGEHPYCGLKPHGAAPIILTVCLEPGETSIYTGEHKMDLKEDFTRKLIESTIMGMLSPLKGIYAGQHITLHVNCRE